ncbi:MAG: hypothetical protein IH957_04950 [Chloroflexi bacterium]|nr:hypothetical protein [Chloroflexota bacterium]
MVKKKKRPADKLCYVIMPFSKTKACSEAEWTDIFDNLIKPAVEKAGLGYQCTRSEATTGNLIKSIVNSLYDASVVIADLTDRNPNVFYELGVRHTLRNRTILLAQNRSHIPSDLTGYASHVYKWKTAADKTAFRTQIKSLLSDIDVDVDRSDNPVADFLRDRSSTILNFQRDQSVLMLGALIAELELRESILEGILERAAERTVKTLHSPTPALDHFIAHQYVINEIFSISATALRVKIALIEDGLKTSRSTAEKVLSDMEAFRGMAEQVRGALIAGESVESLEFEAS